MRVISDLFGHYEGRPILVIGGGPNVMKDLPSLVASGFKPALVLSANEHGLMQSDFEVDYIVHCDKLHCMKKMPGTNKPWPMAEYLRVYRKPLISRWSTADVRLEDWNFSGNSGTTAVAVAAVLGGSPIVVTGLDFWATGRKYFYDTLAGMTPAERRLASKPIITHPDRRLNPLATFVGDAHIRPMSGLLTGRWPKYDPAERFAWATPTRYTRLLTERTEGAARYRVIRSFHWSNHDTVQAGTVLRLTLSEAAPQLHLGNIERIVSPA